MDGGAFYDQSRHWAGGVGGTVGEYTVAGQSKGGVGGQSKQQRKGGGRGGVGRTALPVSA